MYNISIYTIYIYMYNIYTYIYIYTNMYNIYMCMGHSTLAQIFLVSSNMAIEQLNVSIYRQLSYLNLHFVQGFPVAMVKKTGGKSGRVN